MMLATAMMAWNLEFEYDVVVRQVFGHLLVNCCCQALCAVTCRRGRYHPHAYESMSSNRLCALVVSACACLQGLILQSAYVCTARQKTEAGVQTQACSISSCQRYITGHVAIICCVWGSAANDSEQSCRFWWPQSRVTAREGHAIRVHCTLCSVHAALHWCVRVSSSAVLHDRLITHILHHPHLHSFAAAVRCCSRTNAAACYHGHCIGDSSAHAACDMLNRDPCDQG
jgi:hypothetical protein